MRRLLGTLLVVLQLSPVIGAALCLRGDGTGAMPMADMPAPEPSSNAPADCPQLAICVTPVPTVVLTALLVIDPGFPHLSPDPATPALRSGDRPPPPQPPPIA